MQRCSLLITQHNTNREHTYTHAHSFPWPGVLARSDTTLLWVTEVGATSHEPGTLAQQFYWPLTSASGPHDKSANSQTKGQLGQILKNDDPTALSVQQVWGLKNQPG